MEAYAMITHLGCGNGVRVFVCVDKEKQNEMDTISLWNSNLNNLHLDAESWQTAP
jgi:hypothetical protein